MPDSGTPGQGTSGMRGSPGKAGTPGTWRNGSGGERPCTGTAEREGKGAGWPGHRAHEALPCPARVPTAPFRGRTGPGAAPASPAGVPVPQSPGRARTAPSRSRAPAGPSAIGTASFQLKPQVRPRPQVQLRVRGRGRGRVRVRLRGRAGDQGQGRSPAKDRAGGRNRGAGRARPLSAAAPGRSRSPRPWCPPPALPPRSSRASPEGSAPDCPHGWRRCCSPCSPSSSAAPR